MSAATLMPDEHGLIEGVLKQQFTDADGMLTWEKRKLVLDTQNLNLYVSELNSDAKAGISLRGVKFAKEWSFSSPVCGFGFDLVWFSGQLWNFMSDDEQVCRYWVDSINRAISHSVRNSAEDRNKENHTLNTTRPPLPPSSYSGLHDQKMQQSFADNATPINLHMNTTTFPSTIDKYSGYRTTDNFNTGTVAMDLRMDYSGTGYAEPARRYQSQYDYHSSDDENARPSNAHQAPLTTTLTSAAKLDSVIKVPGSSHHHHSHDPVHESASLRSTHASHSTHHVKEHTEHHATSHADNHSTGGNSSHGSGHSSAIHAARVHPTTSHDHADHHKPHTTGGHTPHSHTSHTTSHGHGHSHTTSHSVSSTHHKPPTPHAVHGKEHAEHHGKPAHGHGHTAGHHAGAGHIPTHHSTHTASHAAAHHTAHGAAHGSAVHKHVEHHTAAHHATTKPDHAHHPEQHGHHGHHDQHHQVNHHHADHGQEHGHHHREDHTPAQSQHTTHCTGAPTQGRDFDEGSSFFCSDRDPDSPNLDHHDPHDHHDEHHTHHPDNESHHDQHSVRNSRDDHHHSDHPTPHHHHDPARSQDDRHKTTDYHHGEPHHSVQDHHHQQQHGDHHGHRDHHDGNHQDAQETASGGAMPPTPQVQQRLEFSRLAPAGVTLPSAAPLSTGHDRPHGHAQPFLPNPPASAGAHHDGLARHSREVPTSVRMAERVEAERQLSAQTMSLDRPTAQVFAQEVAIWQSKCQILEMQLERKQTELDSTKSRLLQVQDRLDQTTQQFEQRLDLARDKERQLIAESKREMENKMLRVSNENMSFFEAANKTIKLQHEREMACLREELAEERKRHTSLLDRSQSLRERAERSEAEAQQELAALRDKYATLHVEETRLRRELEIERSNFEKERQRLVKESEATITALQEEKERSLVRAHQELRDKIAELNEKMHASIQKIRESDTEALKHELEGQRIRALAELHKKCQSDIEAVRTEERRLAAAEIENIRSAFLAREHQTAEDLIQLEKLHSTRVGQLEKQLQSLRVENGHLQERLRAAVQEAQHGSQQVQRSASEMRTRMEEHAARAETLHRDLLDAHKEIQEGKAREASYREQLSQAIAQNRLQHAELLEAKQQLSTNSAQVFQWRNVTRESDLSISAAETALRISKDEVAMLEHQLRRVEEENATLKLELQRSDRLVYGAHMGGMRSDLGALNASTLSTAHLLRNSLPPPSTPVVHSALLTPTVSSAARLHPPAGVNGNGNGSVTLVGSAAGKGGVTKGSKRNGIPKR